MKESPYSGSRHSATCDKPHSKSKDPHHAQNELEAPQIQRNNSSNSCSAWVYNPFIEFVPGDFAMQPACGINLH
jgi:hypothetical protein